MTSRRESILNRLRKTPFSPVAYMERVKNMDDSQLEQYVTMLERVTREELGRLDGEMK